MQGACNLKFYIPIGRLTTFKLSNKSAFMQSTTIFENELFTFGGLKTLRGFDENSLSASLYSINSLEYRFIFEQNSALYLFADYAYYEKKTILSNLYDKPYGFGAGIDIETKAGIFTINYALGSQMGNPIQIKAAKIHFGYLNRF